MSLGGRASAFWGLALLGAAPASAHLVTTGLGPFYDGLGHLALTPEDLLAVLAVGLFNGLRGPEPGRTALWLLPVTWLLGGWVGLRLVPATSPGIGVLSLLVLGLLVATDFALPPAQVRSVTALIGLAHGALNGGAMASVDGGALALVGIATGVFVLVTVVTGFVASLRADWTRLVARVAGSWIAAIGLLLFGWWFRGGLA